MPTDGPIDSTNALSPIHARAGLRPLPVLVACAAPSEADAIRAGIAGAREHAVRLVVTGVGKVNAALSVDRALAAEPLAAVINLGIAGLLPGGTSAQGQPLALLDTIVALASHYADEGVQTPTEFWPLSRVGFPIIGTTEQRDRDPRIGAGGMAVITDPRVRAACTDLLRPRLPVHETEIATVSTCSGTSKLARAIADRPPCVTTHGPGAEAMEGAAVGHAVLTRFPSIDDAPPFAEIRTLSNTTGDRAAQVWQIRPALERLTLIARALFTFTDS